MERFSTVLEGESIQEVVNWASMAEDAGFESVWAPEYYRTSFLQLAAVAPATKRIELGTGVTLAFVRSPFITALSALDLDEISGGRLILGLGTGVKRMIEMWHGIPYKKPAHQIKEFVSLLRVLIEKMDTGEAISYNGDHYRINIEQYRRPFNPIRKEIPLYLGGIREGMIRTAGEVAEGLLGHVIYSTKYLKEVVHPNLALGLKRGGKESRDFDLASIITCSISKDAREARDAARGTIAFYTTVRTFEPVFRMHGFEKEVGRIRGAFLKGDIPAMIDAVSDDMVRVFSIAGTPDECIKKMTQYRELIDLPVLSAPHYFLPPEQIKEYQRAILETFGS